MKLPVLDIQEVTQRQLCTGCGVCASVEPGRFAMDDAPSFGRRPRVLDDANPESGEALRACPGASLTHTFDESDQELIADLRSAWGPVYEVWEGHATADDIRYAGSSGGAATALALFAIEQEGMGGVLHTAAREDARHLNQTVYSTTREELHDRTGSRYAPASPADRLDLITSAGKPSVFIGKPCDVAGVQQARRQNAALDAKLGLTIAFFCAGVPSTEGNLALLRKIGVDDPAALASLRYRGNGWPGLWTAEWTDADGDPRTAEMTYAESWGFLQQYRQWRCYICPDHSGEFADIAVGDPWYRPVEPGEPGKSLIIARTKRGRDLLRRAAEAGYVTLETKDPSLLPRSQANLLSTRGRLFGQQIVMRAMGAKVPAFRGFPTLPHWIRHLSLSMKVRSLTSTITRVRRRRLTKRIDQFG